MSVSAPAAARFAAKSRISATGMTAATAHAIRGEAMERAGPLSVLAYTQCQPDHKRAATLAASTMRLTVYGALAIAIHVATAARRSPAKRPQRRREPEKRCGNK